MQIALRTPAAAIRSPASRPACASGWPTWARIPNWRHRSAPEFIETTGIPARSARRTAGPMAGSGIETTRPSGLLSTASLMRSRMRATENVSGDL